MAARNNFTKFALFTLLSIWVCAAVFSVNKVFPATADAAAEIAMELETGAVLTEKNADARLPMASTTKIMTAIVIIEDCALDEAFVVPDEAVGVEGSSIYLKKEEEIDVRDLLYGLMLRSGNDSATALAIHHSGSVEKFVEVMNERAQVMGAADTHFTNPSGLPDDGHYTTARDLCAIACYAMKNETFREVVSTRSYRGNFRSYANKNKMLANYAGANGVKTGYTLKAGRCLVTSAERGGMDVVAVVLNCPDMYERSAAILDYCFAEYKLLDFNKNSIFMCNKVLCKTEISNKIVAKCGENLRFEVKPFENMKKICRGDKVGKLEIYGQNSLIFTLDLYSIMDRN